jgi:3-deoxy-D-manno-octulosonic acid kinase
MDERELETARGGMLYDPSRVGKPAADLFSESYWRDAGAIERRAAGRGSVFFLQAGPDRWVWRHYRRGGAIAPLLGDRYLYTTSERTRAYREFRLLARLTELGLPVPAPVAAQYQRTAIAFYRADLITVELPPGWTLADAITGHDLEPDRWEIIGATIARFHAAGVQHADLNAHNVLLATDPWPESADNVYLLDFDRGRMRPRGPWEADVLARLQRSLEKVATQRADARYHARDWQALMRGYTAADESFSKSTVVP